MERAGLFIGRFQPLHRGHLLMMKKLAPTVERFVVGIGSSNAQPSCKNPFTASERAQMVRRGMKELGIRNYEVVDIPDAALDEEWVKEVVRRVAVAPTTPLPPLPPTPSLSPTLAGGEIPRAGEETSSGRRGSESLSPPLGGGVRGGAPSPFDIAWSGSDWVVRVFEAHHLPIERIKEFPGLSGTKIRRRMAQGLPWLHFMPLSVRKYLREIGSVKRIRVLCKQ